MINNKHWLLFRHVDANKDIQSYLSGNTTVKPYHIEEGQITTDGMITKPDGSKKEMPVRGKWYFMDSSCRLDEINNIMRKDIVKMMKLNELTSKTNKHGYDRFYILKRDNYKCQLCGRTSQDGVKLEIDHKIAKSKGGSDDEDNLWVLCKECNSSKRARYL